MRALVIAIVLVATAGIAGAQSAQWKLGRGNRPHADMPFEIILQVEGFEESPAPEQPKLEIPGVQVTPLGAVANPSRSINLNTRKIDTRVSWMLRYRLVVANPGTLRLPSVTVKQGSKSVSAQPAEAPVDAIPTTRDMKIELALPDRPVFVGETVPVKLHWYFRASPEEQTFTVPLVGLDALAVNGAPAPRDARRIALSGGGGTKDLELPFDLDDATVDGVQYKRLSVTLFVAPRSAPAGGKLEVPASSVIAALQVGRPDFFGRAESRLFRATDTARALVVKPLPETDRPPTFAGAVGEQFSIDARTSRSVVSLGEPVELEVTIKSDQRLDTLSLGKLDGDGRLPKDKFTAPAESPTGELSADGKTKTFKVVAQVTGPTNEIPALAFSYFDPKAAKYQTILSRPIALSVKGGSVVGADDVVVGARKPKPQQTVDDTSLVNADLALSSPGAAGDTPLGGAVLWILVGILYAVPIGIFVFRRWQLSTAESREEAGEVRAARKQVEDLLDRAASAPAREIAGPLVAAMRDLARVLDRAVDDRGLLARIETESFAPEAAGKPLSADLRSDTAGLLRRWNTERRGSSKSAAVIVAVLVAIAGSEAHADVLDDGRQAYQYAMELTGDATGRKAAFARAATALGEAARANPDRPELLTDWGNAALAAGDAGIATLAYRRALALDPSNTRARHNLAWLRGRLPTHLQAASSAGATDTLLFFHRWPRARRLVVGAAAFAIAILLLVPWRRPRRRAGLVAVSLVAFGIWVAMLSSVLFEDRRADDAVVMDAVVMRAADSAGAPPAFTDPLPRGLEVTILERRDSWTRVALTTGATGWVPDGAVERVIR